MAAITPKSVALENKPVRSESQWETVLRRFARHRMAMISLFILVIIFGLSIFAPIITPFPRDQIDQSRRFFQPLTINPETGEMHWFGTDHLGRDYYTRLLYAARVSLTVAVTSTLLSTLIGLTLGMLAGYFGGWVDMIISRTLEFVATFPLLVILLILVAVLLDNENLIPIPGFVLNIIMAITSVDRIDNARVIAVVILTIALLFWTGTARLMRGMVLSVREQPFIESSRALGGSNLRIMTRHVFPNAFPPIIVDFTLGLNGILVLESSLSFLGFGIQDPIPTWGNMLNFAQSYAFQHPWMTLVAGLPILLTSLAINYVGDGLRDALDPKMKI
ncbi:MAG: ABC transporter permease [Chloroflexaceae bacterium]|nr:ABC transporter permease [Chloroflexaceae bacterium]NJL34094.1 ABC transporter permease [Chloroflexaceae bacterium]NJO04969.1 ABC transporter permease [Chloroflexaceae bacterium]NJO83420.1 ABC transporter permease [Blastochloris sp.]